MSTTEAPLFDETRAHQFASAFNTIRDNIQQVIRGKQQVVEQTLLCLMSGGHVLVEDVPGVGKTLLAKALAASVGAKIGRIQFTPDLLPADVTGVNVWNRNTSTFEFRPGPVFTELVLADEINRASPKTQSALLEAMAESQVTVDGVTHTLSSPFMVVATQNPIEQEGTYPLPEAQLDRFQMKISVGYPARSDELQMLQTHEVDGVVKRLRPVASLQDIMTMTRMVTAVQIAPELRSYLIDLADASRRHQAVALGLSPRGTLSLQRVARARAASQGRIYVTDDDIKAMATSVMAHRVLIKPEAGLQGVTSVDVVQDVLRAVPIPYDRK
ncbi:MAG: MoxR family ATPase [Acidimicrobiia bacterium]|nr:MoxR family ATPase [Acidimicrobiia bacterium]